MSEQQPQKKIIEIEETPFSVSTTLIGGQVLERSGVILNKPFNDPMGGDRTLVNVRYDLPDGVEKNSANTQTITLNADLLQSKTYESGVERKSTVTNWIEQHQPETIQ